MSRREASREEFGNLPHRGWQIDMWTDADTHTSYACITDTMVAEPTAEYLRKLSSDQMAQLLLRGEVVAFEQFPNSEHSAENIRAWIRSVGKAKQISLSTDLTGMTPDGAADGQAALNGMEELNEKADTCDLHRLQRAVLFSIGQAGAQCKNPQTPRPSSGRRAVSSHFIGSLASSAWPFAMPRSQQASHPTRSLRPPVPRSLDGAVPSCSLLRIT